MDLDEDLEYLTEDDQFEERREVAYLDMKVHDYRPVSQ